MLLQPSQGHLAFIDTVQDSDNILTLVDMKGQAIRGHFGNGYVAECYIAANLEETKFRGNICAQSQLQV